MQHLFKAGQGLESIFRDRSVVLILDYEGTLTPAASSATGPRLQPGLKKSLARLSKLKKIVVAIISPRPAKGLKKVVGIPGLVYVGNSGLEAEAGNFALVHPESVEARNLIQKIKDRLKPALKGMRGVSLAHEAFTLQVSCLKVRAKKKEAVRLALGRAVRPYLKSLRLVLSETPKGWEVRPLMRWNKGTTVLWLYGRILAQMTEEKMMPVYLGDDRSDEDVFRSLKPMGMGIKVALDQNEVVLSDADYCLFSSTEVDKFLTRLAEIKSVSAASAPLEAPAPAST